MLCISASFPKPSQHLLADCIQARGWFAKPAEGEMGCSRHAIFFVRGISMHTYMYMYVYIYTHTHAYIYIYIHTHTHTCIHIWCSPSCKQFPLDFAVLEYFLWAKEHSDARLMNLSSPWMGDFPDSACLNSSSKKHHGISRFHPPCCWLVSWIGCVSCQTFEHCNSCHITWRIQSASHRSVPSSIFGSPGAEIVFLLQCFDLKLVKL